MPRERVQVYANAIPDARTAPINTVVPGGEGLNILSQSMGSFFKDLSSAADTMNRADFNEQMHNVALENQRQVQEGAADALAGKEAALPSDRDYMASFSRTKGIATGGQAVADYRVALEQQPFGTDPDAFREQWAKDQFGSGTGDPFHDSAMLSTFRSGTDGPNLEFRINSAKNQRAQGVAAIADEVTQRITDNTLTDPVQLREIMDRSITLNLEDPIKGRAQVLSSLMNSAVTPGALQRVTALLNAKGYMDDGKSFSEAFPDSANQASQALTDKYLKALDSAGFIKYSAVEDKINQAVMTGDVKSMAGLLTELDDIESKHGGKPFHDRLAATMKTAMAKEANEIVGYNQFVSKLNGPGTQIVDSGEINKYQMKVLANTLTGINASSPLESIGAANIAATVVVKSKGIATDLKDTMSMGVQDRKPEIAANAYQFWKALEDAGSPAAEWMNKPARDAYETIKALLPLNGNDVKAAIGAMNADPEARAKLASDPKSWDWNVLMDKAGDPPAKVRADVQQTVRKKLAGAFDVTNGIGVTSASKLAMATDVEDEIMTMFGRRLMSLRAAGHPNAPDKALESVMSNIKSDYWTIPGVDGHMQLIRRGDIPKAVNGVPIIGPGVVKNPATGQDENTVSSFKADMQVLNRWLPGLASDPSSLYTAYDRTTTAHSGVFRLQEANTMSPIRIAPGQKIAISEGDSVPLRVLNFMAGNPSQDAKFIEVPKDPALAAKALQSVLPKHVSLIPVQLGEQTYYELGYSFHMSEAGSIDALGAKYDMNLNELLPAARSAYEARKAATKQFQMNNGR